MRYGGSDVLSETVRCIIISQMFNARHFERKCNRHSFMYLFYYCYRPLVIKDIEMSMSSSA